MLVFIDESGDPHFKVEKGASPVFVAAMVIFEADEDAAATQAAIECSEARRTQIQQVPQRRARLVLSVRGEMPLLGAGHRVEKAVIYSPRLRAEKDRFYEYFVKQMMAYDGGALVDAKVIIDGSGDRAFRDNLKTALRRRLPVGLSRNSASNHRMATFGSVSV